MGNMKAEKFKLNNSVSNSANAESQIRSIEDSIQSLNGVNAARVDLAANTVTVDYNANQISSSEIQNKLK